MNGAQSLIKTLVDSGVDVCFANPGTSEMHFVAALDEVDGMRCVLCLFEGVVSGAAYGYAAMAGKPASTLLHLGPGLGNALANIHNARKGHVPMVNIVGDHATYHLQYDAPLTSDIEGIATPVSDWVRTSKEAADIARDAAAAVLAAGRGQIATLVLPADVSWGNNPHGATKADRLAEPSAVAVASIDRAAAMLRSSRTTAILIGGRHTTAQQLDQLGRLASVCDVRLLTETFPCRIRRGAGTTTIEKLPYLAEFAIETLKDVDELILVGAAAPVSFFAYPNISSVQTSESCDVLALAGPDDNIDQALAALVEHMGAAHETPGQYPLQLPPEPADGPLDAQVAAQVFARHLPEDAIVIDEGATSVMAFFPDSATARQHDWLCLTGGAIGWGLPAAVGAAIAQPQRKVICLEGDGSAMYTIQSLWTMARENLDVLVLLFNNGKYNILEAEFARTGARGGKPGPKAASSLTINAPDMDFVAMAQGMGVSASAVRTIQAFSEAMQAALAAKGPHLIDIYLPPVNMGF
ncbi:MAG: acetolactate synthase large subunit [Parahaliea sp.]